MGISVNNPRASSVCDQVPIFLAWLACRVVVWRRLREIQVDIFLFSFLMTWHHYSVPLFFEPTTRPFLLEKSTTQRRLKCRVQMTRSTMEGSAGWNFVGVFMTWDFSRTVICVLEGFSVKEPTIFICEQDHIPRRIGKVENFN